MAVPEYKPECEGLPQQIRESVKALVEQLGTMLGGNLQSITVVGSALTSDFHAGASDVNTVIVLKEYDTTALKAIVSLSKTLRRKRLSPPLLMTLTYLERSRDVFGVELLDFQLTHRTVFGDDPFVSLTFRKEDVRLQCERELKATLVRLRQGYIAASGNPKLVRDVLIAAAKGLAPLLRAMLWLKDIERPHTMDATFAKASETFSIELDRTVEVERWRYEKPRLGAEEVESAFESIYKAADMLATIVDKLEEA
jgi:hypothetical protein